MKALYAPRGDGAKYGLDSSLHKDQIKAMRPLVEDTADNIFLACSRKWGKDIPLSTPVLTNKGWVQNGDLKVGDTLYTHTGAPTKILGFSDVRHVDTYILHFDDGTTAEASLTHRWLAKCGSNRSLRTVTTQDMLEAFERKSYKDTPIQIPVCVSPDREEKELPLDPYLLGMWLGHGSSYHGGYSTEDPELIEHIKSQGFEVRHYKGCNYYVTGMHKVISDLNIKQNKHIPAEYLHASRSQRLALLQGLMDTDGYVDDRGQCEFVQKNADLFMNFVELARSCGIKVHTYIKTIGGNPYHRARFKTDLPIFRLERKLSRIQPVKKANFKTLKKITVDKKQDMRCIAVDHEDHTFIIKDYIVTHNTEYALNALHYQALLFPGSACYYIAPSREQAKKLLWDNRRLHNYVDESFREGRPNNRDLMIRFKNGSFIQLMGAENYEAANGLSPHLIIYDEFKAFNPHFHRTMGPNRATHGAKLIVIGTLADPAAINRDEYEAMQQYCKKNENGRSYYHKATVWDNPINQLPHKKRAIREEIALLRARGDEDVVQREFFSKIIPGGSRAIFPMFSKEKYVRPHADILEEIQGDLNDLEWYQIIDPGTTTCYAGLFAAINPYTKKVYILDEIYETKQSETSTTKIFPKIMEKARALNPHLDFRGVDWFHGCDEAAAWAMQEILNHYGVNYMPTNKASAKKEEGLSLMKDMYNHNLLAISDRCEFFIKETIEYAKDSKGRIPKRNDHLIDCVRYLLYFSNYTLLAALQAQIVEKEDPMTKGRFRRFSDDLDMASEWDSVNVDWEYE